MQGNKEEMLWTKNLEKEFGWKIVFCIFTPYVTCDLGTSLLAPMKKYHQLFVVFLFLLSFEFMFNKVKVNWAQPYDVNQS